VLEEGGPAPGRGLLAVVDGLAARGDVGQLGGLELDEAKLCGLLGLVDESLEHLKFRGGGVRERHVLVRIKQLAFGSLGT
jgi:hypothetical protein